MVKKCFSAYYIFNFLLVIIYPILRTSGSRYVLKNKDIFGFKKEDSILTIVVTILLLRFVKYFSNWEKFLCETILVCKSAISCLLILTSIKLAVWYLFACLVIWLLVKYPRYDGQSNIVYIANEESFNNFSTKLIAIKNDNKQMDKKSHKKDIYLFMIFYSNYSFDCIYTEELFAQMSLKYFNPFLRFGKMDVDLNENFAKKMGINLQGFKVTLPYLIMFKNGEEVERFPHNDSKGYPLKIKYYREKDIVDIFELKRIQEETK